MAGKFSTILFISSPGEKVGRKNQNPLIVSAMIYSVESVCRHRRPVSKEIKNKAGRQIPGGTVPMFLKRSVLLIGLWFAAVLLVGCSSGEEKAMSFFERGKAFY